ncbi:MAG: hypothetical protein GY858_06835 [Candidatus Omnitrophica bacterium]|nr:hypothetical protein [Candidatus Omnitrophota bacterium]
MNQDFFDYKEVSESEEKLNYAKLIECPYCKKQIAHDATMCYFCGEEVDYKQKSSWVSWVAILVLITFLALILT